MNTTAAEYTPPTGLSLYWLGTPRIEINGRPVRLETQKAVALLAYLSLSNQPVPREALAALLWPEFDQSHAFANLRRNLASLDKSLGYRWIEANRSTIMLKKSANLSVDILDFLALIEQTREYCPPSRPICRECLLRLERAVRLYRGEFLSCLNFKDCNGFDDWQYFQRQEIAQEQAAALRSLAEGYAASGEMEKSIQYARRWLNLDRLNEEAQRFLIQAYARIGQRGAAVRQYEECRKILWEELGQPPEFETTAIIEKICSTRSVAKTDASVRSVREYANSAAIDPFHGTCSALTMQHFRLAHQEPQA